MIDLRKAPGLSFAVAMAMALSGPVAARPVDPTTAPPARLTPPASPVALDDLISRLNPAVVENRLEDALAIATAIAAHSDFPLASDPTRLAVIYLIGVLNLELDQPGAALAPLVTTTGMNGATTDHWIARIDAEERTGDRTSAARSLAEMIRRFPGAATELDPTYLIYRAIDPDPEMGFALRAALLNSDWRHPADSMVWLQHVDELLVLGEIDRARGVTERITAPTDLIQLYALHRYDALTADLAPLDISAELAAALDADRFAAQAPDAGIDAYKTLGFAFFARARLDEALATTDAALALPEAEAGTDAWRDRTWVMDTRARTLMALGRRDEAAVQSLAAAARFEEGRKDLSQTINLGWLFLRLDRNAEALATTESVDESADATFDVMLTIQIRACAATALGDAPVAEAAYAYLAANWRVAPRAVMDAVLCRGDVDGAAVRMVQRLDDPDLSAEALSELHHYLPPPAPTPFDARLNAGDAAIAARPEVIAARDRVGRVFSIPTLGGQF